MTGIGIILGSTRPGHSGEQVANWVFDVASKRTDGKFELIDLVDHPLPHLDEPMPPSLGQYQNPAHQGLGGDHRPFRWIRLRHSRVQPLNFWGPEEPIDYLYAEWNNKAMGVVSYGVIGGARAAEHLRLIAGELQMADVRTNVALSMFTDFENFADLTPTERQVQTLDALLGEVLAWSSALAPLRV